MIIPFNGSIPLIADNAFVAPNATIIGKVSIAEDASVWFQCVLRGDVEDIVVRKGANVQDLAMVHADMGFKADIGEYVTVGHHATIHGCTIGSGSLIGINAVVLNGAKIGKNCIIGANALVTENKVIPERSLVLGSPGKIVRQVTDEEIEHIKENARDYVENFKKYKK